MLTQNKILEKMLPVLREKGKRYEKFKSVLARISNRKEVIETITQDGVETKNTTSKGDFIVQNKTDAKEQYILKPEQFNKKYEFARAAEDGFSEYRPIGKIVAVEMNQELFEIMKRKKYFKFMAPWGAPMIVRRDDFLVCPIDFSEIYRIARKEFFETYQES